MSLGDFFLLPSQRPTESLPSQQFPKNILTFANSNYARRSFDLIPIFSFSTEFLQPQHIWPYIQQNFMHHHSQVHYQGFHVSSSIRMPA